MLPKILDANRLIDHWRHARPKTVAEARRAAQELINLRGTNPIVTPVAIEFLGGTNGEDDLKRHRAFLEEFEIAAQGRILDIDFVRARSLAERTPIPFHPRSFADCLIRAIADRLHYDVDTKDKGMPRSLPPRTADKSNRKRQSRR
jgi:predicted nucleic acid-binding protein